MQARILQVIFLIFLTIAFNACGSKIDESVQNSIQEERYSESEDQAQEIEDEDLSKQDSSQEYIEDEKSIDDGQMSRIDSIDAFIEGKIDSAGDLTLTEYEFNKDIVSRAIERKIGFTLTALDDREATIKELENIMKEKNETYRIVKEKKIDMGKVIITTISGAELGTFVPGVGNIIGGFGGALVGLGWSLKDWIIDKFSKKTNWLISKSPDEKILTIYLVKD